MAPLRASSRIPVRTRPSRSSAPSAAEKPCPAAVQQCFAPLNQLREDDSARKRSKYHDSYHDRYFPGTVQGASDTFDATKTALANTAKVKFPSHQETDWVAEEQHFYFCGFEKGVDSATVEWVLRPVSKSWNALRSGASTHFDFGDHFALRTYQIKSSSGGPVAPEPDSVIYSHAVLTMAEGLRFGDAIVAEVKHPFYHRHQLMKQWAEDVCASKAPDEGFRKVLGQMADSMNSFKSKFGMLTCYDYTIFVRRADSHSPTLMISSPIHRSATGYSSVRFMLLAILYESSHKKPTTFDEKTWKKLPVLDWKERLQMGQGQPVTDGGSQLRSKETAKRSHAQLMTSTTASSPRAKRRRIS